MTVWVVMMGTWAIVRRREVFCLLRFSQGYEKARSSLGEPSSSKEAEDAICLSLLSICRSMAGGAGREGVTAEDPTACELLPCSSSACHQ